MSPAGNWHTIMAYPNACGGCTTVQYWSNPDLVLGGIRLGIAEGQTGAADNRKTLNLMAPYVANFRQEATAATPGAATLTSPRGSASATRPTYTWTAVSGATYYYLWVQDIGGSPLLQQWFTTAAVCSGQTCATTPSLTLTAGRAYRWWIQTWNSHGYGPWSANADFTVAAATASATVISLYNVPDTRVGGTARLWAHVQNSGGALPSGARVWFYVTGPAWSGDNYVGSASVSSIQPGTSQWAMFDWVVAAGRTPGTYTYWARVFDGSQPLSQWSSAQTFTVLAGASAASASITLTYPVGTVVRGTAASLWARVRNTGATALPAGSNVWFWVTGPSGSGAWVGGVAAAGLAAGAEEWFLLQWTPSTTAQTGTYTYWAQVWSSTAAISAWSSAQPFPVQ